MELRTKKSHIHNLPEGKPPVRILPRIFKLLYYLGLLALLGGLCYILTAKFLYFTGKGQVEVGKVQICPNDSGIIQSITKRVGDTFAADDILAVVDLEKNCLEEKQNILLTRLAFVIREKQAQYDFHSSRLQEYEAEEEPDILHRALEIGDAESRSRHQEIARGIVMLREKTALLFVELAIKKEELAALKNQLSIVKDQTCNFETIRSSFAGEVYHVTHHQDEFITQGEPLFVVIPVDANVVVETYFDSKNLRYISPDKTMTITFPDGFSSIGKITNFYSAAKTSPGRDKKDYQPVEAKLRVNLQPISLEDRKRWKFYDRLDVRVKGERK